MFQLLEMRPLHAPEAEPDVTVPAEYGTDLLFELETDQASEETTEHTDFDSAGALGLVADGRRRGSQEDEPEDEDFFELEDEEDEEEDEEEFFDDDFEDEDEEDEDLEDLEDEDED